MKIRINFILLILFSFYALVLNILSNGEFTNIGSDFSFYFNHLKYIRDFDIPFSEWFASPIRYPNELTHEFKVPTPFYSLIFLGPLLLHGSNLLFALQGVGVAFLTYRAVKIFLSQIYFSFKESILNLILIIGSLNPAFIKDALTSGPVSICNLFILYGFIYKNKTFLASFLFSCAAMTRSSYIIYWISMLFACFLGSRSFIKRFLVITFPSVIFYLIFYHFFYSAYSQSSFSYLLSSGMKSMISFDNFFVTSLDKYFNVTNTSDLLNLKLSFVDVFKIAFNDLKILYGIFVAWIFKVFYSLGFMHSDLLWDMRSIYIQRFSTLLYFLFFMGPAFLTSLISLLFIPRSNCYFWLKKERTILIFSILFLLIHSITWGEPRYATAVSWIYVAFFVRFISWIRLNTMQNNY